MALNSAETAITPLLSGLWEPPPPSPQTRGPRAQAGNTGDPSLITSSALWRNLKKGAGAVEQLRQLKNRPQFFRTFIISQVQLPKAIREHSRERESHAARWGAQGPDLQVPAVTLTACRLCFQFPYRETGIIKEATKISPPWATVRIRGDAFVAWFFTQVFFFFNCE